MRNKFFAALLVTTAVLSAAAAFAAETVPGDVLVIFKNSASAAKVSAASLKANGEHGSYVASVASSMQARVAQTYETFSEEGDNVFVLMHSDTKSERELLEELRARPDVQGASLNYIRKPAAAPNDRYYSVYPDAKGLMWGLKAISADKVWDAGQTGSDSVYVAVIDTGIYANHEDLKGNIATEYCNGFDENGKATGDYADVNFIGHGTHVSGTIGAVGNNGKGVVGVNWKTKIIMFKLKVSDVTANFSDATVITALEEVVRLKKNNVNIAAVNMSFGGWDSRGAPDKVSNSTDPYWAALRAVSDAGVVLCMSAGNDSQRVGYPAPCDAPADDEGNRMYQKGDYRYPASFRNIPNMIVVAAASQDVTGRIIRSAKGAVDSSSNYGSEYVDVAAPGSCIVSTVPDDYDPTPDNSLVPGQDLPAIVLVEPGVRNYASWPGTSMATPHVTGTVALLKSAYPNATAEQIKQAILYGANGAYCKDDKDSVTYTDGIERVADGTSRCGFLDVKRAYDLLKQKAAEDIKVDELPSDGEDISEEEIILCPALKDLDEALQSAVSGDSMVPLAVFPQIRPDKTGTYYFEITLDTGHAAGIPRFFPGENGTVKAASVTQAAAVMDFDAKAKFYNNDTEWKEITYLTSSDRSVIVAADLKANTVYTPVLAVDTDSGKHAVGGSSSSSGCDAVLGSASALLALALLIKKFN